MKAFQKNFGEFSGIFPFKEFNKIQLECLPKILNTQDNIIVSAPTSSGKTVIFQLCMIKQTKLTQLKCLYLAPIKSLCHEKAQQWGKKFGTKLKIYELTADTIDLDSNLFTQSNIVIATPQKLDIFSRQYLQDLQQINLLLIDEIHMLNYQERGATLEAVVSRIMSLNHNKSLRIVAVSATIPNIKEVGDWLKVPSRSVCVFGQDYRPALIKKVVLGFKSAGNPFTFEKMLNYKIMDVVRNYSMGKGVLIFCPTQKGTESCCQQIINEMQQRQMIQDDKHLQYLIKCSKNVKNPTLQMFVSQGIAFHNGALSMQDRIIVQNLFLDMKIRILCTTSTLSMGVNLPARLVVIKSTKSYKGSGKGYLQYTQIQIDQMSGRAGRPPFDLEGTVVIMTEKCNYNYYLNDHNKLQTLESHLYTQLIQHINAEISLKSIRSLDDVFRYFKNSFCYIRMKKSPLSYGIKNMSVDDFVEEICLNCIKKLKQYEIINFMEDNMKITPKQISINLAKNSVQIQTMITMINLLPEIKTQKQFIDMISQAEQIKSFRSKLDERKLLKQLNAKINYPIKQAISTADKKCFVLIQAELAGINIQNWQLRKQAKEMLFYFKRLIFCLKGVCLQKKLFIQYYWSSKYLKYFHNGFSQACQSAIAKQIPAINDKWKMFSVKGINTISKVLQNINSLNSFAQKSNSFGEEIEKEIFSLKKPLIIRSQIVGSTIELKISYEDQISVRLKGVNMCIGNKNNQIYYTKYLNSNCKQTSLIVLKRSCDTYYLIINKEGFVGFDQSYIVDSNGQIRQSDLCQIKKGIEEKPKDGRKSLDNIRKTDNKNQKQLAKRNKSQAEIIPSNISQPMKSRFTDYFNKNNQSISESDISYEQEQGQIRPTLRNSKKIKLPFNYQHRSPLVLQDNTTIKKTSIKKSKNNSPNLKNNKSLDNYKWNQGLPQYQQYEVNHKRYLKIVEKDKSSKGSFKSKLEPRDCQKTNQKDTEEKVIDAFSYFYNLF